MPAIIVLPQGHAAIVRKIGGKNPWDGAFDEPMTKEDVLAAAGPFLA